MSDTNSQYNQGNLHYMNYHQGNLSPAPFRHKKQPKPELLIWQ